MGPEELELTEEQRRCRAYTDMCVEYRSRAESVDFGSPLSTAVGSSIASSDVSPMAGPMAGDAAERWADICEDSDDDLLLPPSAPFPPSRPEGTWFVPSSTIWVQVPCMPVSSPWETQMAVAAKKAMSAAAGAEMVCTKEKVQTVQRQHVKTECQPCNRTTLVFRRLPKNVTRISLLEMLDTAGWKGLYDFVYLPMDFKKGKVFGYAIVNFISNSSAEHASAHFEGAGANVDWSDSHQGLQELIQRYRDSPIMHASMPEISKPIIFSQGVVTAFPRPTKQIKAPRN